ncbi:MAG: RDD family protein [Candidatus Hodarchaeales archaeon]
MNTNETGDLSSIFRIRLLAFFIDILVIFPLLFILAVIINLILGFPSTGIEIYIRIVLSFSIPIWIYFVFSDISQKGATFGKKLMKIGVKTVEGENLTIKSALLRTLVKLIPWELTHITFFVLSKNGEFSLLQMVLVIIIYLLIFIYGYFMIRTKGRKGVHDLLAKTTIQAK